jgi:GGDEF domain-containing protein
MLISLRKYLYGTVSAGSEAEYGCALAQVARQTMHVLTQSLLLEKNAELRQMRGEILKMEEGLGAAKSPAEVERLGGAISGLVETYRAKMLELEQERAAALQNMISGLQQTVVLLSGGSRRAVAGLQQIERELMCAGAIEDIVALRSRLSQCLQLVREEAARERDEVAANLLRMQEAITRASEKVAILRNGTPDRAEAERILRAEGTGGCPQFAAVFRLERFASIASRFGEEAAGQVRDYFADCLEDRIAQPAQLFRWNEAALLVLLDRKKPKWEVTAEIQGVDWGSLKKRVEAGERVAVLSLSNQWAVFERDEIDNREELIARISRFAGNGQD